ncbi:tRNA(Ile)-lysidine synthase [Stackebrandtia albiflava]|uniref:tRNA(Ile)-lysidine synthase n=1 Tax=Stackebrandtia albiflava TaxID=406432 RepID=A0A562V2Q5_9ACTN|nr:tRNA lysidine(34) synthetase TilS [Stackebrandtia albiflava]TWJ12176.1 tRNA(Ile)-lysidine synthase [Stackebrandtia albiflava]
MPRLHPAVAAVRSAVRTALAGLPPGSLVLVACSGGADSLALADGCAWEAPRAGLRAGLVTVDHGLQAGSDRQAARVADWARDTGLTPVEVSRVEVDVRRGGPEAAARTARYAALEDARKRHAAAAVLLAHTLDDQAETVLLALARGGGPHGLAGMPARRGRLVRPLLAVSRSETEAACAARELPVWRDPHNDDTGYTRVRARRAMPLLTEALGERVVANLARTASLVADDNAVLQELADDLLERAIDAGAPGEPAAVVLADAPKALRSRAIRLWLRRAGVTGELNHRHLAAVAALVTDWRGQRPGRVPGGRRVGRTAGRLWIDPPS